MSDKRSPHDADLPWPVTRGELDDLEALELVRDATGKLAWQNITPPGRDTYRDWLPRRGKGTPPPPPPHDVTDVGLDDPLAGLFASEATSSRTREPLQPLEAPAAPALEEREEPSQTHVLASSTEPLPELPLQAQSVSTVAAAAPSIESPVGSDVVPPGATIPLPQSSPATSMPSSATAVAAPPRLSMAIAPTEDQPPLHISGPPAAPQPRTRAERLALLGAGALIGAMVTMVIGVAWRPDERPAPVAAERPSPAPPEVPPVPSATPAVPVPTAQLATVDAPAPPPAATDIVPVPASPPAHVAAAAPSSRAAAPARRPARESGATATATRPAASPAPIAAPPEVLVTIDRFAAVYNRMDATATQAVWPTADRQALVTTFTALREQRLTLSRCRGTMQGDTAIVLCRGTLRYRPRVGNHDTQILEGNWRFTMLQRADDWVVENVESP